MDGTSGVGGGVASSSCGVEDLGEEDGHDGRRCWALQTAAICSNDCALMEDRLEGSEAPIVGESAMGFMRGNRIGGQEVRTRPAEGGVGIDGGSASAVGVEAGKGGMRLTRGGLSSLNGGGSTGDGWVKAGQIRGSHCM